MWATIKHNEQNVVHSALCFSHAPPPKKVNGFYDAQWHLKVFKILPSCEILFFPFVWVWVVIW